MRSRSGGSATLTTVGARGNPGDDPVRQAVANMVYEVVGRDALPGCLRLGLRLKISLRPRQASVAGGAPADGFERGFGHRCR